MAAAPSIGTLGDLIVYSLEDLSGYDFKKFKNKLTDFSYEDKRPIPRGRLENADCVTTKNLLVDTYGELAVPNVIFQVFRSIGLEGPANDLQESIDQEGRRRKTAYGNRLKDLRKKYKEWVEENFQWMKEHNSRLGESVDLQVKYTPILMIKGYPDRVDKEREIVHKVKSHTHPMKERYSYEYSPTTLHALFDPDKGRGIPKVVVLHGPTGIGKTWTSRKIMLDWASGNLYQDRFDFVFFLSCRELNAITGRVSLVQLLSRTCSLHSSGDLESVLKDSENHGRLLFVIDGFDELRWTPEERDKGCDDPLKKTHKERLLRCLLRKQVLNQSSLLITTRPLAQKKLNMFIDDPRYVEIKGFSDKDIRNYFLNSFKSEADAKKTLNLIEENNILSIMCTVPLLCWILCTVLRQEIKKGLNLIQYKTTTSIYLLYLQGLMMYHGRTQPVHARLKKLCALAKEGMLNHQILFEKVDLERHGLSVSEVESVFLNENIFHVSIKSQSFYSFIHLSVQEFLTALYYVLDDGDEEGSSGVRENACLPEICKGGSLSELCDRYPHLSLAVQFLFGLLYEKQLNEFSEDTGCKISLRVRSAVEEWLTSDTARSALEKCISSSSSYYNSIDVISCLYETQNEDLIRRALPLFSSFKLHYLWKHVQQNKNDLKQLCYCLKLCEGSLCLFDFRTTIYSEDCKAFSPVLHRCQELGFTSCVFHQRKEPKKELLSSDISWLINPQSKIQDLRFTSCVFHQRKESKKELLISDISWLINPQSKIQDLRLHRCNLSDLQCDVLRSVLVTNKSLTKLDLSVNPLKDSGVTLLCAGLKNLGCPLQELSFEHCNLSHLCCQDLCAALVKNRSLNKLNLSNNRLKNSGVKHLCEWLGDPDCALQEISLRNCDLSSECCDDLRSVLVTNRSLTKLNLSRNPLKDSGVNCLCERLRDPDCTLQELSLIHCDLSPECCDDLRSALVTNRSLTKLDLTENHLKDSGVKLLCEGLRIPGCTLQVLSLCNCDLSDLCCDDLRSAIVTNQSITLLHLSNNNLADFGVKLLCEGLRDPRCTLQDLRFTARCSTLSCCEEIHSVIATNRNLTKLGISLHIDNKEISDTERSTWCEAFRHLGCFVHNRLSFLSIIKSGMRILMTFPKESNPQ